MTIKKINSLTDVVDDILSELETGGRFSRNSSDYYELALDEDNHTLSVSVTLETGDDENWYSIHVSDEITTADHDLHSTESTSRTELLYELVSILYGALDEIIK